MKSFKLTKGFTLIEVLVSVLLITAALGISLLYLQSSQLHRDVHTQATVFASYVRLVQSNAMSGLESSEHGIHLEEDSYTTFVGSSYDPASVNNYVIELPPKIRIENISLNGSGNDIIFEKNGETTDYGSLDFVSLSIDKTINISISGIGNVNY